MSQFLDVLLPIYPGGVRGECVAAGWHEADFSAELLKPGSVEELKSRARSSETDLLVVEAAEPPLNREAAEMEQVDVLMDPGAGREDRGIDHVTVREAARKGVAIGFRLRALRIPERAQKLAWAAEIMEFCEKFGTDYLVSTGAERPEQVRAPREASAVISALGFDGESAVRPDLP
jgi:ribonuclease P/MRP protein subunit RPP1